MTVAELLEKSYFCDYLEVTIRENGEGQWIYQYIIGENVRLGVYSEVNINGEWRRANGIIDKACEYRKPISGGRFLNGKVFPKEPKKSPKEVMELEISEWRCMTIWSERDRWGLFITAFPKGWTKPLPEQKETEQMTLW